MRGKILWIGEQNKSTALQSPNTMHWRPPIQGRRNEICSRIVICLLTDRSKMLMLDPYWETWYFVVREQTCSCYHQMDGQQPVANVKHNSSHRIITHVNSNIILSCGKYSTTMHIRIVSRLWFCRRSRRLKINIRWTLVHFRKTHVRSHKLDVEETDFSFTVVQKLRSFLLMQVYAWTAFPLSLSGSWWLKYFILPQINSTTPKVKYRETCRVIPHQTNKSKTKPRFQPSTTILDLNDVDCVPSNAKFSRFCAMLYILEENEAVIKMIKGRSPTMRHVSRTHRVALDWLFDRINLVPKNSNQSSLSV